MTTVTQRPGTGEASVDIRNMSFEILLETTYKLLAHISADPSSPTTSSEMRAELASRIAEATNDQLEIMKTELIKQMQRNPLYVNNLHTLTFFTGLLVQIGRREQQLEDEAALLGTILGAFGNDAGTTTRTAVRGTVGN